MLRPCASCSRLVRGGDAQCPFCGSAERNEPANKARGHLSRAARIVGAAAISVACGGSTEPTPAADSGGDTAVKDSSAKDVVEEIPIGPMYGGPFDASVADASDDTSPADAGNDTQIIPPYGGAPLGSQLV